MNWIPKILPADVISPGDMLGDLAATLAPYLITALAVLLLIAGIVVVIIIAKKSNAEIEKINKNAESAKENRMNNVSAEKGDCEDTDDSSWDR